MINPESTAMELLLADEDLKRYRVLQLAINEADAEMKQAEYIRQCRINDQNRFLAELEIKYGFHLGRDELQIDRGVVILRRMASESEKDGHE